MSESQEDILQLRREGEIAVLTLNNPRRMNALGTRMRAALYDELLSIEADESCRAIVLTGAGGNFCSGGDISEMKHREILEARSRVSLATRIVKLLVTGAKPFICAVEGNAAGAGLSLVAASDYAVAAHDAKFACAFIKVGLMPDFGAIWSLPRKVGLRKAMELCALAESFGAEAALQMQLINRICPAGQALEEALATARRFARNPPIAMALMKAALNTGGDTLDAAAATEIDYVATLQNTADFAEAADAFMQKRKPVFKGR